MMLDFFRRNKNKTQEAPPLADLSGLPLAEGDTVESLRYDLGTCRVIFTEKGLTYQSLNDGRQVSWHRMVDAATDLQKVKKHVPKSKNQSPETSAEK